MLQTSTSKVEGGDRGGLHDRGGKWLGWLPRWQRLPSKFHPPHAPGNVPCGFLHLPRLLPGVVALLFSGLPSNTSGNEPTSKCTVWFLWKLFLLLPRLRHSFSTARIFLFHSIFFSNFNCYFSHENFVKYTLTFTRSVVLTGCYFFQKNLGQLL